MKPDQERVKNLLTDTVTLLCKNGLFFNDELRIEGLLGVTIDSKDAFFVHISEQFGSGAEHNDGNIIANVLSSKDSSKFLSERRKSHRTDDSPQRSRDSARSTPTRPLSQQSSHSPGIREPRSEKRKSLDTPPGVRVKKERYDDDLMLIDSKRRVPLPHGPLSQDDAEAMRQSYGIDANSLGQIQQVQVTHQLGEVKRQSASHLVDAGGGTFVTSMVRQESGATNSPTGNPWPDLAAQVSGGVTQPCDSQMTLDSLPGSSQWSPAQSASQLAATTQPPSASDMLTSFSTMAYVSALLQEESRRAHAAVLQARQQTDSPDDVEREATAAKPDDHIVTPQEVKLDMATKVEVAQVVDIPYHVERGAQEQAVVIATSTGHVLLSPGMAVPPELAGHRVSVAQELGETVTIPHNLHHGVVDTVAETVEHEMAVPETISQSVTIPQDLSQSIAVSQAEHEAVVAASQSPEIAVSHSVQVSQKTSPVSDAKMSKTMQRRSWQSRDKPHTCPFPGCNRTYFYHHDVKRHIKQHHGGQEPPEQSSKDVYVEEKSSDSNDTQNIAIDMTSSHVVTLPSQIETTQSQISTSHLVGITSEMVSTAGHLSNPNVVTIPSQIVTVQSGHPAFSVQSMLPSYAEAFGRHTHLESQNRDTDDSQENEKDA